MSLGIYGVARGPLSPKTHVDIPDESASAPLRGTDWNGPLAIASNSSAPAIPIDDTPSANATSALSLPASSANPPPLSAIAAPLVPLPLDEAMSEKQRARGLEMLTDRLTLLDREAAAADARGEPKTATEIRVRMDRLRARISTLQDGGATP